MGKLKKNIGWCDKTINVYWGCLNNCSYCISRRIAKLRGKRIGELRGYSENIINKMMNFQPIIFPNWENIFDRGCIGKPKRIFMNMMSDIYFWPEDLMAKVLDRIREYPQHTFMFLTKFLRTYYNHDEFPPNCMMGITVTSNKDLDDLENNTVCRDYMSRYKFFVSIEPLLERLDRNKLSEAIWIWDHSVDWVIIGAETGNRKNKIIPEKEWIKRIVVQCDDMSIPVFLKGSLRDIWEDKLIQEYPG